MLASTFLHDAEGAVEDAALWVKRRLPAKSQLSATDAQQVEEAFAAKLLTLQPETAAVGLQVPAENARIAEIDKSVLAFPGPSHPYVRHVIRHPCLVCGRQPSDPHHLRFAQSRATTAVSNSTWVIRAFSLTSFRPSVTLSHFFWR